MKNLMILALVSLTFAATGCSDKQTTIETTTVRTTTTSTDSTAAAGTVATIYTCPMHPEVVSSQPGQCPKCHMELVAKK